MSQLNETNATITNFAGDTSVTYTDKNGMGIRYARTNEKGLAKSDAFAEGVGSTALGYEARATQMNALAMGRGAQADFFNSIALGAGSRTVRGAASNYAAYGLTAPQNSAGELNIGNRQITGVAAGSAGTDAVNVSQLKAVGDDLGKLKDAAVKYEVVNGTINYNKVVLQGDQYDPETGEGGTTITNVAKGVNDSDAVNMAQLKETNQRITVIEGDIVDIRNDLTDLGDTVKHINNGGGIRYFRHNVNDDSMPDASAGGVASVAVGSGATTTAAATNSMAMGMNAKVDAANGVALGANTRVTVANSVALGSGAIADQGPVAVKDAMIGEDAYGNFAGFAPVGVVSVGSKGAERQITNVAAGRITAESTDAINGSQLYSVADGLGTKIKNLDQTTVKYETNVDGTVNYNNITLQGEGGTQIHNVADGTAPQDAATVNQLNNAVTGVNQRMDGLSNRIETVGKQASAGTAGAMAAASLPQATLPGKSMLSAAVGGYDGQAAIAIGVSKLSDNGRWILKGAGTANSQGRMGVSAGVGFHW
ncbi:hypothetical protein A7J71_20625 [Achromobacter insolitus]|nr:hypothetical protein A7J71_20625 [Achromobacter insolitus]OCZ52936.1 hypothetical protein A7P22_16225 [Achromobacter insolitus]